jgi:hypothetical protein
MKAYGLRVLPLIFELLKETGGSSALALHIKMLFG